MQILKTEQPINADQAAEIHARWKAAGGGDDLLILGPGVDLTTQLLVQLDAKNWVAPKRVVSIAEDYYPSSQTWQTRVRLLDGSVIMTEVRADLVAAKLNRDLR